MSEILSVAAIELAREHLNEKRFTLEGIPIIEVEQLLFILDSHETLREELQAAKDEIEQWKQE